MPSEARIGVVGLGSMGTNHVNVISRMPHIELGAIYDANQEVTEHHAQRLGTTALTDIRSLAEHVDGVILAAPTELHGELGAQILEQGLPLLIEKPIATNVGDAEKLIELAAQKEVPLLVGHIEAFNPAIVDLPRYVNEPTHVSVRRLSPYPKDERRAKTGVVLDLMVHDVHILQSLVGASAGVIFSRLEAQRKGSEDIAHAYLQFENGATADITASRIHQGKVRQYEILQSDSEIIAELINPTITILTNGRVEYSEDDNTSAFTESVDKKSPYLSAAGEPLVGEINDFSRAIQDSSHRPRVIGQDGLAALKTCLEIHEASK